VAFPRTLHRRGFKVGGFDEHLSWKNGLQVGRAATGVIDGDNNQVLVIVHETVDNTVNSISLLSFGLMQANNVQVDTTRFKNGGFQCLFEPIYVRVIPLVFQGGMYRIRTRCPTDQDLLTLPHIIISSPIRRDPHAHDDNDSVVIPPLTYSYSIGFTSLLSSSDAAPTAPREVSVFQPHLQEGCVSRVNEDANNSTVIRGNGRQRAQGIKVPAAHKPPAFPQIAKANTVNGEDHPFEDHPPEHGDNPISDTAKGGNTLPESEYAPLPQQIFGSGEDHSVLSYGTAQLIRTGLLDYGNAPPPTALHPMAPSPRRGYVST
jgi:hypothetical protein